MHYALPNLKVQIVMVHPYTNNSLFTLKLLILSLLPSPQQLVGLLYPTHSPPNQNHIEQQTRAKLENVKSRPKLKSIPNPKTKPIPKTQTISMLFTLKK